MSARYTLSLSLSPSLPPPPSPLSFARAHTLLLSCDLRWFVTQHAALHIVTMYVSRKYPPYYYLRMCNIWRDYYPLVRRYIHTRYTHTHTRTHTYTQTQTRKHTQAHIHAHIRHTHNTHNTHTHNTHTYNTHTHTTHTHTHTL